MLVYSSSPSFGTGCVPEEFLSIAEGSRVPSVKKDFLISETVLYSLLDMEFTQTQTPFKAFLQTRSNLYSWAKLKHKIQMKIKDM
jgi:hypothetical protein